MKVDRRELMIKSWRMVKALKCTLSAAMKFTWKRLKDQLFKQATAVVAPVAKKLSYKEAVASIMNKIGGMNYGK